MLKKESSEHRFKAYQYLGDMKSARELLSMRPGYVDRHYDAKQHDFTNKLRVLSADGEKLLEPNGWVLFYDGKIDCMSEKEFFEKHFELFF